MDSSLKYIPRGLKTRVPAGPQGTALGRGGSWDHSRLAQLRRPGGLLTLQPTRLETRELRTQFSGS